MKKNAKKEAAAPPTGRRTLLWLSLLILAVTFAALSPALRAGFVNWDDQIYVTENPLIQSLDWQHLRAIFSAPFFGNYQPVTLLSYAADLQLYGLDPRGFHLTSLVIHLINCLLVLWLIWLLCRDTATAVIVALLFGVHPLHVESVAWVAERKDVLYALFYLAALIAYIGFLRRRRAVFYILSLALFLLSLLSKPMAVTLPLVLLLYDRYVGQLRWRALVNKIPFLLAALAFGVIAVSVQARDSVVTAGKTLRLGYNLLAAGYGLVFYVVKLAIPLRLCGIYPHPAMGPGTTVLLAVTAAAAAAMITGIVCSYRHSRLAFFCGSFYLTTLLPVLQIIPAGNAIAADRYSYLPAIGIFFLAASILVDRYRRSAPRLRTALVLGGCAIAATLAVFAWQRTQVWHDSITFWNDVIAKQPGVATAYNNRGRALERNGDAGRARDDYTRALTLDPRYAEAWYNRGNIYLTWQRSDSAIADYSAAVALDPLHVQAFNNRGIAHEIKGDFRSALADYDRAIELDPRHVRAYNNRGHALYNLGRYGDAIADYDRCLQLDPSYFKARYNRGLADLKVGDRDGARADFAACLRAGFAVDTSYLRQVMPQTGAK